MERDALDILASVTTELLQAPDLRTGLQLLTDGALRITPADHASVRLCGDGHALDVGARSGAGSHRPAAPFARGQGLMGWVAQTGQAVRVGDSAKDPRFEPRATNDFPMSSVMSVPITAEGRTLGVLSMSAKERDAFVADDETMARLLANSAAQVLRSAELERMTITDAHTSAYNRRHLIPRLTEEMSRAGRRGEPLCLLLMDLDHFKRVNDRYGHAAGDEVLKVFAERVRAAVRSIDVLIRRGGEEFVLILPDTDEAAALQIAERIRSDLGARDLQLNHATAVRQTVSIGVAVWDGRESPDQLDERADHAMYAAKHAGRDRVAVAEPAPDARTTLEHRSYPRVNRHIVRLGSRTPRSRGGGAR